MKPLITEKSCLACHARQGYREGDVRGGISVILPFAEEEKEWQLWLSHILAMMAGMAGIVIFGVYIDRSRTKRDKIEKSLRKSNEDLGCAKVELAAAQALVKLQKHLESFIQTAQYLANLTAQQNVRLEMRKIISNSFKADLVWFAKRDDYGAIEHFHYDFPDDLFSNILTDEIDEVINEVFETEFLAPYQIPGDDPYSMVILPIRQGYEINDVIIIGHRTSDSLPNELLNAYLGVINLAETMINRLLAEEEQRKTLINLADTNKAYNRFVPHKFLEYLNKESIIDIQLGDCVEMNMSILFTDIRSFTTLSEQMTPDENFKFLNSYLSYMGPAIREHNGFVDKYIGDAIMALFDGTPNDAVNAGIDIMQRLSKYNESYVKAGHLPVKMGIGINTGNMMLGTIGEDGRMEGTVISDSVNLAARIEGMTKMYDAPLLISDRTFSSLKNHDQYSMRIIDKVQVEGKLEPVTVYEVLNGYSPEVRENILSAIKFYEEGIFLYYSRQFEKAEELFQKFFDKHPDKVSRIYIERCRHLLGVEIDDGWDGTIRLEKKK